MPRKRRRSQTRWCARLLYTHNNRLIVFRLLSLLKIECQLLADGIPFSEHVFPEPLIDHYNALPGPAIVRIQEADRAQGDSHDVQ